MVSVWAMDYLWKYQDANNIGPAPMGLVSGNASNRLASTETDLILGEFNLFMDAGVCVENRKIGMGALVSNCMGHVLFSSAAPCAELLEPHVAEVKALLYGLSCCVQMGYTVITA
uniref:RNase H type-1 domain-containing protein n=1 Tax=Cannabis sativa TaxID=3483 RepID=A0A803QFG2_CANSA